MLLLGGGLAALGLCSFMGCARWRREGDDEKNGLPSPQISRNVVVVEVAFVRVTETLAGPIRELWQRTDEQNLSVELRRELYANGLRVGTVGTELPSVLRQALEEQELTAAEVAKDPEALDNPTARQYRLQCRAGKIIPLIVSPNTRDRTILLREGDAVRGQTFVDSQCILELEASPLNNGMASVHLIPMVEFGEAKNRPVGENGVWQVGIRKEQRRFSNLSMAMHLRPGETVMLTATEPAHGLGGAFMAGDDQSATTRIVLVRLAQTQGDGVFDRQPSD